MGILLADFPQKELPFTCGNSELMNIPENAKHFVPHELDREMQYDIGLSFHVIYGKYALTDITLHLLINEHNENGDQTAGILLYDMFTKHWLMDDWISFTEPNQSLELTFTEKAGPHYLRIYSPHQSGSVSGYITDSENNILISWSEEDFIQWQSETVYNSIYINFDTGLGETSVGKIPEEEIQRAVNRLNHRHTNASPFHFIIDSVDYTHNNSWAIGGDLWNSWESIYTLAYNSQETLNIFSIIGFYYNLSLGGVGLFPWTIENGDPNFYRVSMKSLYLTDLTAEEGRDHVFDHEVGHSLGLLHTFNYGCDLDTHGDYVSDTPTHAYANNVCDYTVDSCPDDPGNDPVDNLMNYVYGPECQMGFSIGQYDRTLWAINTWVPSLIDTITTIISVPEDFNTIQEALNSADVGYGIHVSPGTYYENLQWPDTDGLSLIGSGPDSTIIDGNHNGRVIEIDDEASPPIAISGFTITNGQTNGMGGGIEIEMTGELLLSDLVITNNHAISGGGIVVEGIGGIWMGEAHVSLERVVFSDNSANEYGGGYYVHEDNVSSLMKHTTFVNNSAGISGGGIYIPFGSHYAVLANSILWNNTPEDVTGYVFPHFSNLDGGIGGEGNITTNPNFVDSSSFFLLEGSSCIDSGSPLVVIDLDSIMLPGDMWMGDTIINVNPAYYGGNAPDMGAYESHFATNLNPEIEPIDDQEINEDEPCFVEVSAAGGTEFTFVVESDTSAMSVYMDGSSIGIDLQENWNGIGNIGLIVTNEFELSDTTSFQVTVLPVNDTPFDVDIVNPEDGDTIVINQSNQDLELTFEWEQSFDPDDDTLSYIFLGFRPGRPTTIFFVDTITNTECSFYYHEIANDFVPLFSNSGVTDLYWEVLAFDGNTSCCSLTEGPGALDNYHITFDATSLLYTEEELLPNRLIVYPAYPNPFNPIATLRYDLPDDAYVTLSIHDMMGRRVTTLIDGPQTAGNKTTQWNGTDAQGRPISAGLYLYTIHADEYKVTKKIVFLK